VQRACGAIFTLAPTAGSTGTAGQIVAGVWRPAPDGDVTAVTYPACDGERSASAVAVVVPSDVPPGDYDICLTMPGDIAGCAPVTVDPPESRTSTSTVIGDVVLTSEYLGRRPLERPPFFAIDRFAADGTRLGTLSDAEVASLSPIHTLGDGSTVELRGESPPQGRCANLPLVRSSGGAPALLHPELADARSVIVTATDVVVAGRDVCPPGTRWGDPGTRWELVAVDLAGDDPTVVVLQTRQADPSSIQYDDGDVVVAVGELRPGGASPDGRYVSLLDLYHNERARWHVIDLEQPGEMLALATTCPLAGDIVGPPNFVGADVVVVARVCAAFTVADEPVNGPSFGDGDVHVEAVDLGTDTPGARVHWHSSVSGLGFDSYSRTVGLSARRDDDGGFSALLTAGGGVELPSRTFALRGDMAREITQPGYLSFVFADCLGVSKQAVHKKHVAGSTDPHRATCRLEEDEPSHGSGSSGR
jgi:hypothetical protein